MKNDLSLKRRILTLNVKQLPSKTQTGLNLKRQKLLLSQLPLIV